VHRQPRHNSGCLLGYPAHTAKLLRECCEWHRRRTANKGDEIAPPHVPPENRIFQNATKPSTWRPGGAQKSAHRPQSSTFNNICRKPTWRTSSARARMRGGTIRISITKFVPDRRFAGGSPRLVVSIFCPLPDRQLHKYQPAGPRDARVNHHNLLIIHVTRHPQQPTRVSSWAAA
jgi:hypothetical protein